MTDSQAAGHTAATDDNARLDALLQRTRDSVIEALEADPAVQARQDQVLKELMAHPRSARQDPSAD